MLTGNGCYTTVSGATITRMRLAQQGTNVHGHWTYPQAQEVTGACGFTELTSLTGFF